MVIGAMFMPSLQLQGAGNDGMLLRHRLSKREMMLLALLLASSSPCSHHIADAFMLAPSEVAVHNIPRSFHLDSGIRRNNSGAAGRRGNLNVVASPSCTSLASASFASQSTSSSVESSSKDLSSGDHSSTVHDEPILRTLYDPPPPIQNISDYIIIIDDSAQNNTDNEIEESNDKWFTHITCGTLPTEEGSPHVLHYEVHHRFQQRHQTSEPTQQRKQGTKGLTALFLHGGPGAACFPNHIRFFSPQLYETVVLLDQRGCGRSIPRGRVDENTLELLVEDVERLRVHLLEKSEVVDDDEEEGKEDETTSTALSASESSSAAEARPPSSGAKRPWDVILGGSWGCTLAMAYAHAYPNHVRAMVLRGICLFRPREIDWLFGDPAPSPPSVPTKTSNLRSLLSGVGVGNRSGGDSGASSTDATAPTAAIRTTATASSIFPREWEEFRKGSTIGNFHDDVEVPSTDFASTREKAQRRSILHRYYHLLLGSDPLIRFNATRSWMRWEMGIYSSGFRCTKRVGDNQSNNDENDDRYGVLVWNPHAKSWAYEDARVSNNQSFVPISRLSPPSSISPLQGSPRVDDRKELPQSLRRFPSSSIPRTRTPSSPSPPKPIPLRSTATSASIALKESSSTVSITTNSSSGNSTTDATSSVHNIIPAQAMLTCYYSSNDEYCIGRYRSFLSLEPPPLSNPMSSWYSSRLPPLMPQLSTQPESSSAPPQPKAATSATTSFPLPPTIAIQGANDAICPPDTALDLHEVWNEMELRIVMNGGHSMYDPVVTGEIVKALDRFGHELNNELN